MTTTTGVGTEDRGLVRSLWTMLIAGALSTVAFDYFGQSFTPMFGWPNLAPVPLATQTWQTFTGVPAEWAGQLLHYVAGMIAYPLGWMLIVDPLRKRFGIHWFIAAVAYGVALWIFALYIMAHLINGNPAFLGFQGITWVALAGHVLFAIVTAAVVRWREGAVGA